MKRMLSILLSLVLLGGAAALCACDPCEEETDAKPVIYLYPTDPTEELMLLIVLWETDTHLKHLCLTEVWLRL